MKERKRRIRKGRVALLAAAFLFLAGALAATIWLLLRPQYPSDLREITPPDGTQLLCFPIDNGAATAGYRNETYRRKNGYAHYGIDFTAANGGRADILASGDGAVLGAERRDNSLGSIAVIHYDNVYMPYTGETMSLIGRYYHMMELHIEEGDTVSAGQVIGVIDRSDKWWNHIHLELDRDVDYPFHTPQVAEASSQLLNRYPANGEGLLDPIHVLAIHGKQHIFINPGSDCCAEKDKPLYRRAK